MALETTKTTYLNGSSKDGGRVLANFSSSLSESGTMTINETISDNANLDTLDTVEADFNEFRELAKNELKKLNAQDTEANVSSDKTGNPEVTSATSDDKPVDTKPVETTTKADSKPETGTPDEAKVSDVKDSEEAKEPVASEVKQPIATEEPKQPVSSEEIKQPASSGEAKVSDVKDGENADESNQLRHQ
ncbi:hypothetical protein CPEBRM1_ABPJDJAI_00905 [Companilactobacillus paralimentarius]|uniref:hypothetical protein n=1 Tax=Companilactobacillus paralimentarius TaxID=83526 RepID=UPI00384D64AF